MPKIEIVKMPLFKNYSAHVERNIKQYYEDIGIVIINDIVAGIRYGRDMKNGRFPALEPETIAAKGHADPLQHRGLLMNTYTYNAENDWRHDRVNVTVNNVSFRGDTPRNIAAKDLQDRGIDSKRGKKYFYFFGISEESEDRIVKLKTELILNSLRAI